LPMSRNAVQVELRANELADAPLQRDSFLRGATVTIDVRKGTPLANVQGAVATVQRGLSERLSSGGNVLLASEGDAVLADGARVDVSGGQVQYQTGILDTTKLFSHGDVVDIGDADPNRQYDGFASGVTVAYPRWGVTEQFGGVPGDSGAQIEAGYVEGKDAGSVQIIAHDAVIAGAIDGRVVAGTWQRAPTESLGGKPAFDRPYDQVPKAGVLLINLGPAQSTLRDVVIDASGEPAGAAVSTPPDADHVVHLANALLTAGGFGSIAISTNGLLTVATDGELNLRPGGAIALSGGSLNIQGDIRAPGGRVALQGGDPSIGELAPMYIGAGVTIDASGGWVNDFSLDGVPGAAPLYIDGGSIDVAAAGDLLIGPNAVFNVSGGAYYSADGHLTAGKGGSVAVSSQFIRSATQFILDATFLGYGLAQGGSLSISANQVFVMPDLPPQPLPPDVPPPDVQPPIAVGRSVFTNWGFENISFTANRGDLVLESGAQIAPQLRNLVLSNDFATRPTGTPLLSFASTTVLPDYERRPVNLSFNVQRVTDLSPDQLPARLVMQPGASIVLEPGAHLALKTTTQAILAGSIRAPGGDVSVQIAAQQTDASGYQADQAIWLTPTASIDVSGAFVATPNDLGLTVGTLYGGGSVELSADRGYVVALPGSTIDVSGFARAVDLQRSDGSYQRVVDYRSAGTIDITAAEGAFVEGTLSGCAPTAAAAGGTLSVALDVSQRNVAAGDISYSFGARQLFVADTFTPRDFQIGGDIEPNGFGEVPVGSLTANGFDTLVLAAADTASGGAIAPGAIDFTGDVALALRDSLTLDAAIVRAPNRVDVSASYAALGQDAFAGPVEGAFPSATGTLTVRANLIDVRGQLRVEGADQLNLTSAGDIRLIGELPNSQSRELDGGLLTDANVTLTAGQIYPSSLTNFRLDQRRDGGTVEIVGAAAATPVLSAGGSIQIDADNIVQGGALKAPGGRISLNASDRLELSPGSLTSVSLEGATVLLGETQGQLDWIYSLPDSRSIVFDTSVASALAGTTQLPPAKSLALQSNQVVVDAGAVIDTSGGGALLAYEFVPGPGGSKDTLSGTDGAFAILPAQAGSFGAYDTAIDQGYNGAVGAGIELAGVGGVPSGTFAVLPARYALLPGAFLVVPDTSAHNVVPGTALTGDDGVVTVAGRATRLGTPIVDSTWSGFDVLTRDQALQRSEFALTSADTFFANRAVRNDQPVPSLPADAGNLRFTVDSALEFLGVLRAGGAANGRSGTVDIEAIDIEVGDGGVASQPGAVQITPDQIAALGTTSLLLGGRRSQTVDGLAIDVNAQNVQIDAGVQLQATDLILAANDAVTIGSGARLEAVAATNGTSIDAGAIVIDGDAALVRVANGSSVIQRTNVAGLRGSVDIGADAVLRSTGTVQIDAPRDVSMDGSLSVGGGTLAVGASRVALTDAADSAPGLVLTGAEIAASGASVLLVRSGSSIDIGNVALSLDRVSMDAAALVAVSEGHASIMASEIDLGNASNASPGSATQSRAADLSVATQRWVLTGGAVALDGFASVAVDATDRVVADASANVSVSGDLAVTTPQIVAMHGAQMAFDVGGDATFERSTAAATTDDVALSSLGGAISLAGQHVNVDTAVFARGGRIAVVARATDGTALVVGPNGVLDASGLDVTLGDQTIPVSGGTVALTSSGDVDVRAGARIAVRGSDPGGNAGTIQIASAGDFSLDGLLDASHPEGADGGTIRVDEGDAIDVDRLADLVAANGFSKEISFASGAGDLMLSAGHALAADLVRLVANAGTVEIGGTVQATRSDGEVDLVANNGVTLHDGAVVAAGDRVAVNVEDSNGELRLEAGSTTTVTNEDGEVRLRIALGDTPLDSRVTLAGALPQTANTVLEAVTIEDQATGVITATDMNSWRGALDAFMSGSAALVDALGESGNARFSIRPGLEIRSAGDLALAQAWNLVSWRFNGLPGALTLRAGGTLEINADLSDGAVAGFDVLAGRQIDKLLAGPSWDLALVGGADLSSADVERAVAPTDVVVGPGARVRTGSGRIDLSAGRDIVLADANSVVYTMGETTGVGNWPTIYKNLLFPRIEFPTRGGDVTISAGRDVVGSNTQQLVSDWMERVGGPRGKSNFPATYGVLPGSFREGVGSLGGGSVTVSAGRDVVDLSVELPVTAQHAGDASLIGGSSTDITFTDNTALIQGGGDLSISAGRDVIGGFAYLGKGQGIVSAGGSVRPASDGGRGLLVGLADATIDVVASGDAEIESAINPTALPEVNRFTPAGTFYFTYSPDAAVNVTSLAGNAMLGNDSTLIEASTHLNFAGGSADRVLNLYPGTVTVASLQGDVELGRPDARDASFALFPAANGGLTLLAKGNVIAGG